MMAEERAEVIEVIPALVALGLALMLPGDDVPDGTPEAAHHGLTIRGKVVDTTGTPIPGARVTLTRTGVPSGVIESDPLGSTTSGPDGNFELARDVHLGPEALRIEVERDGHEIWCSPTFGGAGFWPFEVTLRRGERVKVEVRQGSGRPIPEGGLLWVSFRKRGEDSSGRSRSPLVRHLDPDGGAEVWVARDEVEFTAWAPGFPPSPGQWYSKNVAAAKPLELRLPGRSFVNGKVLDAVSGDPIPGVQVTMEAGGSRLLLGRTDPGGDYRIPVPRRSVSLRYSHSRHLPHEVSGKHFVSPKLESVRLQPARTFVIRLTSSGKASSPLPTFGMAVGSGPDPVRFTWDPARKVYRSQPCRPQSSTGRLQIPGFIDPPVSWPAGHTEHDLGVVTLEPGPILELLVTDREKKPILGATVSVSRWRDPEDLLQGRSPYTDPQGRWSLGGIEAPAVTVTIQKPGYRPSRREITVNPVHQKVVVRLRGMK